VWSFAEVERRYKGSCFPWVVHSGICIYVRVYVWVYASASVCVVYPVKRALKYICLYICVWLCVWSVCAFVRKEMYFPWVGCLGTANPTWGDIFESSKLKARRVFCHVSVKRDVRALSFDLWNSIRKCHPKWDWLYMRVCVSSIPWIVYQGVYIHVCVCVGMCMCECVYRVSHETCTQSYISIYRFIFLYICVWLCVWGVCVKCVCVCMWREVYLLSRVPRYVFVYVRVCVGASVYLRVLRCMWVRLWIWLHTCVSVVSPVSHTPRYIWHIYACVFVCVRVFMCVCMRVCVYLRAFV